MRLAIRLLDGKAKGVAVGKFLCLEVLLGNAHSHNALDLNGKTALAVVSVVANLVCV
jgi:hypothetical protein